jgi:ribonuclease BN (tRNA processing enzyme)
MPKLIVLGGAGWIPTARRLTNCYLIETRRSVILLDCGVGAARLLDPMLQAVLKRSPRALVLLSHYHHDHVEGLHYLLHLLRDHEVTLAAPPAKVAGAKPADILARYGGTPLLPKPIASWRDCFPKGFELVELKEGRNQVAGETVDVIAQPHSDPSTGLRVRDVTYVTDTVARKETVAFAAKSAVLIHDAWLDPEDEEAGHPDLAHHGTAVGAAKVAAEAQVQQLLLGHLNPRYDAARLERMLVAAMQAFPKTRLADDFATFELHEPADEKAPPAAAAAPAAPPATSTTIEASDEGFHEGG